MPWIPVAISAASAIYGAVNSKKAADKSADAVSNLQYQPIDLKALQEQARTAAEQNAINSKALEQEVSPDVARARAGSQKQVADDLALGGKLPTDVANQVTSASEAQGNSAGLYGGSGPLTAANLGLTALSLKQQRLQNATQLTNVNPSPVAGLDPGALASAAISQNNAANQFNLSKTGAANAANNSTATANNGLAGALAGTALNIYGAATKKT